MSSEDPTKQSSSQVFLEDLPPKFDESEAPPPPKPSGHPVLPPRKVAPSGTGAGTPLIPPSSAAMAAAAAQYDPNKSMFTQALGTVQASDFGQLSNIPCFRKAMLTGGAVGAVAFGVLVTARWPARRALNWAVGGFIIGSIGSWEQCRFQMRRERKNTEMAREIYRNRQSANSSDGKEPPASAAAAGGSAAPES
ncbi:uncharacterized protein SAPINGB_P003405 [Magnusiomyces paraingens]|uniref:Cytochrome c oxidase assembly protein COX20, mitochondrial n=1 Tax=Magnusiomyces paraingens TaxID=2606893 RepID=A0A5E8BP82_9ASCO|nr:uncharacterized protein SAPINGB_P003405 [Saprochaete ingens]VVT53103.1 unnamed protein product [Saprochaete ingens]